ncbi:MAG: UDP-N-acetylmuramate dehydrogenase [Epsilonproteobacteria bacterium]|nr:UDP-N-acetylmuramate dehydrogenase [Campylobacterota bacterium]
MRVDFAKFSSIKIGSVLDVKIVDDGNYDNEIIIGRATNSLVCSGNIGLLDDKYDFVTIKDGILRVGAKTKNAKLYNFAKAHNIGGFEFLSKLPGSVGGSVRMNAGMKDWVISTYLLSVNSIDKSQFEFGYRYCNITMPIFEVAFEIHQGFDITKVQEFANMRALQPKLPSLGSTFKNPPNDYAGRLLEAAGLKGERFGNVGFSQQHANFLVNYGGGSCDDVLCAIATAKKRVFEMFGVMLQEEIKIYN